MEWLFSGFAPSSCTPGTSGRPLDYDYCRIPGYSADVRVHFSQFTSAAAAIAHYRHDPVGAEETSPAPGILQWTSYQDGQYKAAEVYEAGPWSVSVYADSPQGALAALRAVGSRPSSEIDGIASDR